MSSEYDETDNYVITQYKSANQVIEFLIHNAYYAMNSTRANIIFEPIPQNFKSNVKINKNFDAVMDAIKTCYDDIELVARINMHTYRLIRFILQSNKIMLVVDTLLKSTDSINVAITDGKSDNIKLELQYISQFKIIHTPLIENSIKQHKTHYLYHGSPYENWYSIMRNGIKIGSKSKYFLNGAAYGGGIYLASAGNISFTYSQKQIGNKYIVSIFEVIDNPKWNKRNGIFVVDDEDALLLRYLIVFDTKHISANIIQGFLNTVDVKLNTGGLKSFEKEKADLTTKNITTIHNKRLAKEYNMLAKQSPDSVGFHVKLVDDITRWHVYITNIENINLANQMKRLGIGEIKLEIIFKDNYPIAPPFIRIITPRFKHLTGHITSGGSICMEMLTNQGWCPAFSIENVITQIKLAICDGNGVIDEIHYKKEYLLNEAEEAFNRMLATHGWV